jgi:putative phage-type endonuclease
MSQPESGGPGQEGVPHCVWSKQRACSRDDWLAVRRTGIGGSDAAAAVGLNPYMSPLELWLDKTGRDAGLAKPDPHDTTEPVYWGTLLEPIVAAAYTQQTGNRVRKVNAVLQHPTIPFMLANLDREIVGVPGVQILECKTAGEFGARLWRDGVPEYVQLAGPAPACCHRQARRRRRRAAVRPATGSAPHRARRRTDRPAHSARSAVLAVRRERHAASCRRFRISRPRTASPVSGQCRHGGLYGRPRLSTTFADLVAVRAEIEMRSSWKPSSSRPSSRRWAMHPAPCSKPAKSRSNAAGTRTAST